jgi:hypothetical protein
VRSLRCSLYRTAAAQNVGIGVSNPNENSPLTVRPPEKTASVFGRTARLIGRDLSCLRESLSRSLYSNQCYRPVAGRSSKEDGLAAGRISSPRPLFGPSWATPAFRRRMRWISEIASGLFIAPCPVGTINSDFAVSRCELQYGTTPSELFGVSPLPRSPIMEWCGERMASWS